MSETKEKKIEINDCNSKNEEKEIAEELVEVGAGEDSEFEGKDEQLEVSPDVKGENDNVQGGEDKSKTAQKDEIDWHDRCLRTQAELANATKTIPKRIKEGVDRFKRTHFSGLIELADGFDRAAQHMEESSKEWQEGFGSLQRILLDIMKRSGVEKLNCKRQTFDPNWHEVVSAIPNPEMKDGEIMEVVRAGYKLDDKLLRAAMVVVAKNE